MIANATVISIYNVITPLLHNAKSNTSRFGSAIQVLEDYYYAKAILWGQIFDEKICWRDSSSVGSSSGGNLPDSNSLESYLPGDNLLGNNLPRAILLVPLRRVS